MPYAYVSFQSDDISETSTDVSSLFHPASILPGFKSSFIAVGRNMKQWRRVSRFPQRQGATLSNLFQPSNLDRFNLASDG